MMILIHQIMFRWHYVALKASISVNSNPTSIELVLAVYYYRQLEVFELLIVVHLAELVIVPFAAIAQICTLPIVLLVVVKALGATTRSGLIVHNELDSYAPLSSLYNPMAV